MYYNIYNIHYFDNIQYTILLILLILSIIIMNLKFCDLNYYYLFLYYYLNNNNNSIAIIMCFNVNPKFIWLLLTVNFKASSSHRQQQRERIFSELPPLPTSYIGNLIIVKKPTIMRPNEESIIKIKIVDGIIYDKKLSTVCGKRKGHLWNLHPPCPTRIWVHNM